MRAFQNQIKTSNPTFGLKGLGRTALTYTLGLVNSGSSSAPPSASNMLVTCSNLPTYSAGKSDIIIIVPFRAFIYSVLSGTAALTISGTTAGDTVKLTNNGIIMGLGGTQNSGAGGTALSIGQNTTVDNAVATTTASGTACSTTASVLTVGGTVTGVFYIGMVLSGTGVTGTPVIVSFGTGSGGAGTYNISTSAALGSRTITGTFSSYIVGGGGAGGRNSANSANGGGGAGGTASTTPNSQSATFSNGGGGIGGRQVPGIGGPGGSYDPCSGYATTSYGAGAGGGGGVQSTGGTGQSGDTGGAGNNAGGSSPSSAGGGGGGGWGAAGGTGGGGAAGGTAGKAVALNGNSITWVSGDTSRVWGGIS